MGLFRRIFGGSVKAALLPIAIIVAPVVAVVAVTGYSSYRATQYANNKARAELDLDEVASNSASSFCRRYPQAPRCLSANCSVSADVKKINDEADNMWNRFNTMQSAYSDLTRANRFQSCALSPAGSTLRQQMGIHTRNQPSCRSDKSQSSLDLRSTKERHDQVSKILKDDPKCNDLLASIDRSQPIAVECNIESFVKEVSDQSDTALREIERVSDKIARSMAAAAAALPTRGSAAIRLARTTQCIAALKEPMAKYQELNQQPVATSCRNNYEKENEKLVTNSNLLAAFKNKLKESTACNQIVADLGWSRNVAVAPVEQNNQTNPCDEDPKGCRSGMASAVK